MKTHAGMAPEEREYRMQLALMASIIYAGAIGNETIDPLPKLNHNAKVLKTCVEDAHRLMAEAAVLPVYSCLSAPLE